MSLFRKITISVLLIFSAIVLAAVLTLIVNRSYWISKLMTYGETRLKSAGLSWKYELAQLEIFPPRVSLRKLRISRPGSKDFLVSSDKTYIYLNPAGLVVPSISPVTVRLIGFKGVLGGDLLKSLEAGGGDTSGAGEGRPMLPTLIINEGEVRLNSQWKSIVKAEIGIDYLFIRTDGKKRLKLIYKSGKRGMDGEVIKGEDKFRVKVNSGSVNASYSRNKVVIRKLNMVSELGRIILEGYYDIKRNRMEGHFSGNLGGDKLLRFFKVSEAAEVVKGGKLDLKGGVKLDENGLSFKLTTRVADLIVRGVGCEGVAECILDEGNLSLKNVTFRTPAGVLSGGILLDTSTLKGKGRFDVSDFRPGEVTPFIRELSGISASGSGKGHIVLDSPGGGEVRVSTHFQMDRGFSIIFPQEESITWNEPVEIRGEMALSDVLTGPVIDISKVEIYEGDNRIDLAGEINFPKDYGELVSNVNIHRVESLALKGIFAKSGEINGRLQLRGPLSRPSVEGSMNFKSLSLRNLPPGDLIVKGSGKLDSSLSLVADFVGPFGTMTFTGTYFPSEEIYFTGNLEARDITLGPFFSGDFLGDDLHAELVDGFPYLFPVGGKISFDGDLVLGEGKVSARGTVTSPVVSSGRINLESVEGTVDYDSGELKVSRLSCKALGGEVDLAFQLLWPSISFEGKVKGISPASISQLNPEKKEFLRGEPIDGDFRVKVEKSVVKDFTLKINSPMIYVSGAQLAGMSIEGELDKKKIALDILTEDSRLAVKASYDLQSSHLGGRISFKDFSLTQDEKAFIQDLGVFGVKVRGDVNFGLSDILRNYSDPLESFLSSGSMKLDISAAPFFSEYDGELPTYEIKGNKSRSTINLSLKEKSSGKALVLTMERNKSGSYVTKVTGGIGSGKLPVILPSGVMAILTTDTEFDLAFDMGRFPHGMKGKITMDEFSLDYPGEKVTGKRIDINFLGDRAHISDMSLFANENVFLVLGEVRFDGRVDLTLKGDFDAGIVRAIVKGVFESINGRVSGEIKAGGKLPDIEVSGQGNIENTNIKFVGFDHALVGARGKITFFKDRILFDDLSATISGGDLSGAGEISILRGSPVTLFFSADVFGMDFSYPREFPSRLEGSMELTGPVDDLVIRGDVNVESAIYTEPVYPEMFIIEAKRRVEGLETPIGEDRFAIGLDIECSSDGTIRIKNNLAEGTVRGNFRVLGDTSNPYIIGAFESVEGEIKYRGVEYDVERLQVEFETPLTNNPRIDGLAKTIFSEHDIFVRGEGRLDDLKFDFYSDPPLSKTDIVSLLSLGRTTEDLSDGETSSTTAGLATVAFASLRSDIEERVRMFTGFERFSVETRYSRASGTVEPMVVLGKDLGSRFSIDFSSFLTSVNLRDIVAEYRLMRDVYLRGDWTTGESGSRRGNIGGELRVKKYFEDLSDMGERFFGGGTW